MAAAGVTSVTNAFGELDELVAYQDAHAAGEMFFRMCFMPGGHSPVYAGLKTAGVRTGFGDEWLRIGAVKYAVDGSASERTMRMSTPYQGRPDDFGILTMSAEEVLEAVNDARDAGFQIGLHANGDVAIAMVLDAYEKVLKDKPLADPRYRIEHCTLVNNDLLKRIKNIGAIPTPFYTYAHYHGDKWGEYGEEKLEHMFAHRSFLDYGIMVAPASDYPPGPFEPLMAIQSMTTRKDLNGKVWGGSQKISVAEAIEICTMNGAYASFEENLKGSITPGKLADFVMLARDPFAEPPDAIKTIPVVRTVLGGDTVFEA
jgi:predicted amidohydrolase YtcJ